MFKIDKFWCCYQTVFGVKYTNLDDNLYWRLYTRSRLSTGCERQFRFEFIREDNISYTWSTIGESVDTAQKVSAF